MEANLDATEAIKHDPVYKKYLDWLSENGCVFPSLEYPVSFGKDSILGAAAKRDIGPNKAYVFVPYSICINAFKAQISEISQVFNRKFFTKHSNAKDHVLWVFVLYERLKGPRSFWHPYFSAISGHSNLIDWTEPELAQLQDPLLSFDCQKWKKRVSRTWEKVSKIIAKYPEFFPPGGGLFLNFLWAWKVCCTRGYAWEGGMLIPLADNLNHSDVSTIYERESKSSLEVLAKDQTSEIDYSDFSDIGSENQTTVELRLNKTRLEKLLQKNTVPECEKIWDLDRVLEEYRSSSSEEDERVVMEQTSSEESAFEQYDDDRVQYSEDYYFIMCTGARTAFKKGEQVFNDYGRLSNRNLLIDYGFALEKNRYDLVYFLLWTPRSRKKGLAKIDDSELASDCAENTELYGIKRKKLDLDIFAYFRETLEVGVRSFPTDIEVELEVIDRFLKICFELLGQFPSTLEEDYEVLERNPGSRLRSALYYRISQKEILVSQVKMLEVLRKELEKILRGMDITKHLVGRDLEEIIGLYPLRGYLKTLSVATSDPKKLNR